MSLFNENLWRDIIAEEVRRVLRDGERLDSEGS